MKSQHVRHAFAGTTRQTRLRIDEGLVPSPDERTLRHRDRSGQKLRDVINPKTGFCTGVTGPMESDGTTVRAAKEISASGTPLPEYDTVTGVWWMVGPDGPTGDALVIRTTTTPDGPLRRTRIVKKDEIASGTDPRTGEKSSKKRDSERRKHHQANRAQRADKPKPARITDIEISAYLLGKYGFVPNLTPRIRQATRAAMVHEATVKAYGRDLRAARKGR